MEKVKYRYYSSEQLEIESIDSRLTEEEKIIRRYLMNYVINNDQAFNISDLYKITEDVKMVDKKNIAQILENLLKKNAAVVHDNNINFIYPVSAISTNHKVTLRDGRDFSAMCAIDAMGTSFTFKQDVEINSSCSHCGDSVKVSIKDNKLNIYEPNDLHILHVDLNKNANWSGNC